MAHKDAAYPTLSEVLYKYVCSECSLVQFYAKDDPYPGYRQSLRCPNGCEIHREMHHSTITMNPYGPVNGLASIPEPEEESA